MFLVARRSSWIIGIDAILCGEHIFSHSVGKITKTTHPGLILCPGTS
jgi:hypothetical protein